MTDERDERPRRRRGRRGGRRRGGGGSRPDQPAKERQPEQQADEPVEWNWRSFPVLFAFSAGVLLMGMAFSVPIIGVAIFFIGLFGVAFGLAHIATRAIVARRRRQQR